MPLLSMESCAALARGEREQPSDVNFFTTNLSHDTQWAQATPTSTVFITGAFRPDAERKLSLWQIFKFAEKSWIESRREEDMFWDTVITRADLNTYDQDAKIKVRRSSQLILFFFFLLEKHEMNEAIKRLANYLYNEILY